MQRLGLATLSRRLCGLSLVSAAACETSMRFSSSDKNYVNKVAAKKVQDKDDERWLEAELDENINTPEERFARQLEVSRLKKMVEAMNAEHAKNLDNAVRERKEEVEVLKSQMSVLQTRLNELSAKK